MNDTYIILGSVLCIGLGIGLAVGYLLGKWHSAKAVGTNPWIESLEAVEYDPQDIRSAQVQRFTSRPERDYL